MSHPVGVPDPSSFANLDEIVSRHISLDVRVDFDRKVLNGSVTINVETVREGSNTLILDTRDLTIFSVIDADSHRPLNYELKEGGHTFGRPLHVTLPEGRSAQGSLTRVHIEYETSPSASALQWLSPAQTSGKQHPYLFTQCQAIHARSMLPCQDTPGVKQTYDAAATVPSSLVALMSAESAGHVGVGGGLTRFLFVQRVQMPTYLIAMAAGRLVSRDLGPRSRVWSEAETIEAAAHEFAETEEMLSTAEGILGPYVWGRYDMLLLPPSFPYGGMENPMLTFLTPTLLAGDRSLADVVAHEISHSWTGNLVTNKNWEHFWLNEGFTMFAERKIIGRMKGVSMAHFSAISGCKALRDSVEAYGHDSPLTALVPDLKGVDPDDAFSSIPYEKGFNFLFYLETVAGGPEKFEPYLKAHVDRFKFESIVTDEWRAFMIDFFDKHGQPGVFNGVDWDAWFKRPGMPIVENTFDQTLANACTALAKRWLDAKPGEYDGFSAADVAGLSTHQLAVFLEKILLGLGSAGFPREHCVAMEGKYGLTSNNNAEIKFRWQQLCVQAEYEAIYPKVVEFITSQGRMKYVRPLYRSLFVSEKSRKLAVDTFQAHSGMYHNIAATMIAKDLKLA
eukprot:Opistho-2@42537